MKYIRKYLRKDILILLILLTNVFILKSEITYRISGKAVSDGIGISNIRIECVSLDRDYTVKATSDSQGDFFFYVPNGLARVYISNGNDYIGKDVDKVITVGSKNVTNVVFFLEKEGSVSGRVQFVDGTPIKDAEIVIYNERGSSLGSTDSSGYYKIRGLRASTDTRIKMHIPGVKRESIDNITLNEGDELTGMDFNLPRNTSINGNVVDMNTQMLLKDVSVFIYTPGGAMISNSFTSTGGFKKYNLSPGKYILLVFHPEYRYSYQDLQISGDGPLNVTVEMEKLSEEDIQAGKVFGFEN
ncbi:MAG: carboxypeptidase regulatory-like domain-containing protein [bacterium]|nr:carboxypeptidase regulatory-like domain-containing protein [bacterium]